MRGHFTIISMTEATLINVSHKWPFVSDVRLSNESVPRVRGWGLRVKVPRQGIGDLAYVVDEVEEKHVIISGDGC